MTGRGRLAKPWSETSSSWRFRLPRSPRRPQMRTKSRIRTRSSMGRPVPPRGRQGPGSLLREARNGRGVQGRRRGRRRPSRAYRHPFPQPSASWAVRHPIPELRGRRAGRCGPMGLSGLAATGTVSSWRLAGGRFAERPHRPRGNTVLLTGPFDRSSRETVRSSAARGSVGCSDTITSGAGGVL